MMRWWSMLVLGCWLSLGVTASGGARYQVIDLGSLGEVEGMAVAINSQGQVLGGRKQTTGEYTYHLFIWDKGVVTDLNLMVYPGDINNLGQIVLDRNVDSKRHAFLWDQGVLTDLGNLEGMNSSSGSGINDSKQVVGWAYNNSTYVYRAFL